ncbi:pirin family protein [Pseudonocardia acidicola]|uniref:Pirin family protein n=1 Tax=Pseudonocardia acidicola TaxID=2724939 RepID=A0ABX1S463_9PSEU|nr:pirin family protein [Pseudonocardia acidicola]NMH95880.1 pirin family protein [Pseudonocardia acidicola]
MSNTATDSALRVCAGTATAGPVRELLPARTVQLGASTEVRRLLPSLDRRMVGAWCFVDHYGPDDIADEPGMQVAPHPHVGLQTVSWLLDGEVHHRDSLGGDVLVRPGELALMTAGAGIAHSEQSPDPHAPVLHGAQLWIALPDADRVTAPRFEHHLDLPVVTDRGLRATVLLGELGGAFSPGRLYSPLVGVDIALDAGSDVRIPLEPDFEHAVLTVSGAPDIDGELDPGTFCYLGCGRSELRLRAGTDSRMLLLGGVPFAEEIVMWWNFVGSSGEEVAAARADWQAELAGSGGNRFGAVCGYDGPALAAPELPATPLRPRGRTARNA